VIEKFVRCCNLKLGLVTKVLGIKKGNGLGMRPMHVMLQTYTQGEENV
jgi:hypothetical protein